MTWLVYIGFTFLIVITALAYLCSQLAPLVQIRYIMFDWSIYRLFVLNKAWKPDILQIMIFVYVCSTCSVFGIKTRFETWITWNEVSRGKFVSPFLFNNSYGLPVLTMGNKCPNHLFYVWLVVLQTIWAK
jgi:hypothetical protein